MPSALVNWSETAWSKWIVSLVPSVSHPSPSSSITAMYATAVSCEVFDMDIHSPCTSCTWGLHQAFCHLLSPYSMALNRIWSHLQGGLSARACEQHFSSKSSHVWKYIIEKIFSSLKILYTLLHFYLAWKSLWKHLGPVDINRKMGKTEKRHFIKEIQMANKHMKRYSSLISNQRYANLKQK